MNKKGMTLIEIVISIAILSIMAAVFVTSMATYFRFISEGRGMTEDVFSAQRVLEEKIESIKLAIFNGADPDAGEASDIAFTLFSGEYERQVEGYKTEAIISSNRKLVTVVGSDQLVYPVPELNNIAITIRKNGFNQSGNFEYALKYDPNLSLRGTFNMSDPEGVFLVNRHEWFVSRKGFTIPIETNSDLITEGEVGRLYPLFPNDYDLIPLRGVTNQLSQDDLNTLISDYAGRHIVYTASPFALSGKKGVTVFSEPVFLHGPTATDGLVLHLDASLISKDPTKSNLSISGDTIGVNTWYDLSGNNNAVITVGTSPPVLKEVQYQDDVFAWGKSLAQNGSVFTSLAKSSFNNSPSSNMTVFIVAKINGSNPSTAIVSGNDWEFGWNGDGDLAYRVGGDYSAAATASLGTGIDNKWHVFTGVVSGGSIDFRIDGNLESSGTATGSLNASPFNINLKDVEIAEILIYNNALNPSTSLPEVENFLIDKYDPDPSEIMSSILYLKAIPTRTILKNDTFTPPNPVAAMMSNGTTQNVFVNWNNPSSVDTTTIGTYAISANAVMDNTKTVTMTVNVVGIDYLERHANPLMSEQDVPLTLPAMLNAVLTNGTNRNVAVDWTSNSPSLSISGNILTGTVIGTYNNGITATATLDSSKSVSYDVVIAKSYLVRFIDWDGTVLKEDPVAENTPAIAPADPIRTGYTFTGWDKAFNNITADLIVQAQYTPITYTVRFEDWDGTLLKTQNVAYGNNATPPADPTRTGFTFAGWSGTYTNVTSDTTVTALYDVQILTVRFVDWNSTLLKEEQVTYGGSATAPVTNPTRTGYTFSGWSPAYTNITGNLTVTAQYTGNQYTVARNLNYSGAPSLGNITVTFGSQYNNLGSPTRSGYTFDGWYTSTSGGTRIYDTTIVNTPNNHTLYAQWSTSPGCNP
ncbi:MAG TPA: hypothetical protein DCG34_10135 [Clostridiales bacterium]|nr:hypothetical protein [Clostridiales bacterium]